MCSNRLTAGYARSVASPGAQSASARRRARAPQRTLRCAPHFSFSSRSEVGLSERSTVLAITYLPVQMQARVVSASNSGSHVEYEIVVEAHDGSAISTSRQRYSAFLALHQKLAPNTPFPAPKRLLHGPKVISERLQAFEGYITAALGDCERRGSVPSALREFLCLEPEMGAGAPADVSSKEPRRLTFMSPELGATLHSESRPFTSASVGTFSCRGATAGARPGESVSKANQDRGCVSYPLGPHGDLALFCVFDGHGTQGDTVADFVVRRVPELVAAALDAGEPAGAALAASFEAVDGELSLELGDAAVESGTTGTAMLYQFDSETHHTVWIACVGDSRAVLQTGEGTRQQVMRRSTPTM